MMERPKPDSDAALIAASLRDGGQFYGVFERHFGLIHRFIAARAGASSADDLASEVFLVAFRRRADYDLNAETARPWLLGIAVRVVAAHFRGQQRGRGLLRRVTAAHGDGSSPGPHARVDATTVGPELEAALAELRHHELEVLLLSAWGELSYEEIAAALRVPVGTVRSRLSRARTKLQTSLNGPSTGEPAPLMEAGE